MADTLVRVPGAERDAPPAAPSAPAPQATTDVRVAHRRHRLPVHARRLADARCVVQHTFADGLDALPGRAHRPRRDRTPCMLTVEIVAVGRSSINTGLRRRDVAAARALRVPAASGLLSALIDLPLSVSPVVVGLALLLVYNGRNGWFGPTPGGARHPGDLHQPRHDHGHRVRVAAAGRPRGRPGARGDRRRPGAGRPQPRRQRAADASAGSPCRPSSGPSCTASC